MICRRCGTLTRAEWRVCPKCAASLGKAQRSTVRCRACGSRVPAGLRICPECGHRLRAQWRITTIAATILVLSVGIYAISTRGSRPPVTQPVPESAQVTNRTALPDATPTFVVTKPVTSAPVAAKAFSPTALLTHTAVPPTATTAPSASATATPRPTETPTATAEPSLTPILTPTTTATPEPATMTPTAQPSVAPTSAPTATATRAAPTAAPSAAAAGQLPAPTLIEPANESKFAGRTVKIRLAWEPVRDLAEDEWYAVSVRYYADGATRYTGTWQKDTSWQVPAEIFQKYDPARPGYEWDVVIMRQTSVRENGGREGIAISASSETRTFSWK